MEYIQVRMDEEVFFAYKDQDACLRLSQFLRASSDFTTSCVNMESAGGDISVWVKHEYQGEEDSVLTLIQGMVLYLSPGMAFYEVSK